MIFKFRIVSDEVNNFKREISIDGTATFEDLKNAICDSVAYDKNQMCSFFICDDDWEKQKEITLEDMDVDPDQDVWLMDECELSDYLDEKGQKLMFTFDYMTDRSMFMELVDVVTGRVLKDPVCTLSLGQAPAQVVDLDEFTSTLDAKVSTAQAPSVEDLDEEFYGSEEYSEDEFDSQGFGEMSAYDD